MGTTAEGASGAGENPGRNWQRGATRRAILDAARLIAARQGSTDFSLNAVAKEAGFSTTALFAYFQTKSELLNAIVADDLAAFARQMRDRYSFTGSGREAPPAAPVQPAVEAASAAENPAGQQDQEQNSLPEASTVVAFAPPEDKTESMAEERAKQAPRADAWLERRLRVFEKSLADVETRLTAAQADSIKALAVAEESTRIFGARLDASDKRAAELSADMSTRLSAAEKRLRENHGELRNSLLNISTRIDSLEKVAQSISAGVGYIPPVLEEPLQPVEEAPSEEKPLTAAADTYLSAARRAAQAAAALSQMEETSRPRKARSFWLHRQTAMLAVGIAALFVFGAVVAYSLGERVGRSTPVRVIAARGAALTLPLASPARLKALARDGNSQADLLIGLRYLKGDGVAANAPLAAKWIRKAAAHDPVAQYWMGRITEQGEGVSADAGDALRWYQAAAAGGNRDAMYNLGVASAEGLGTQRDFGQSARWFAKAASLGVTNAQFNLAVLYERGEGVVQSLPDAYKWYAIAAANGDAQSRQRADVIATQLSQPALEAAKRFASSFKTGALPAHNVIAGEGRTALAGF